MNKTAFRIVLYAGLVLAANLLRLRLIPETVFSLLDVNLNAMAATFLVINAISFSMMLKLQGLPKYRRRARLPLNASFILILLLLAIALPIQPIPFLIPLTTAGAALTGWCYHHFGDRQPAAADPGGPPPGPGS